MLFATIRCSRQGLLLAPADGVQMVAAAIVNSNQQSVISDNFSDCLPEISTDGIVND